MDLTCPNCGAPLDNVGVAQGQEASCPTCGHLVSAPAPASAESAPSSTSPLHDHAGLAGSIERAAIGTSKRGRWTRAAILVAVLCWPVAIFGWGVIHVGWTAAHYEQQGENQYVNREADTVLSAEDYAALIARKWMAAAALATALYIGVWLALFVVWYALTRP